MARSHVQTDNPEALAERLRQGDERTLARVLTLVENRAEGHERVLDAIFPGVGKAWRIGLTGPPGSGKSTLANRIIGDLASDYDRIAYLTVDPTSPFSGGALLGDRVRLGPEDAAGRIFARSLASRGAKGGLSEQTEAAIDVLDAAGFEAIIVESVGVGQSEIDISQVVDTVVVVLVPESGDEIQVMKAGLIEVADILCVNKSDRTNANALLTALEVAVAMRRRDDGPTKTPIVSTTAVSGGDVDDLLSQLRIHRDALIATGRWMEKRRDRFRRRVETLVTRRWLQAFWTPQRTGVLEEALQHVDASMPRPYELADKIISETEDR